MVLVESEPQVELQEISRDTANARDAWTVAKVRMQMRMQSGKDDVKWAEVKQLDKWSFGRQLQYSRKKLNEDVAREFQQKEKRDPLQDMRKDP